VRRAGRPHASRRRGGEGSPPASQPGTARRDPAPPRAPAAAPPSRRAPPPPPAVSADEYVLALLSAGVRLGPAGVPVPESEPEQLVGVMRMCPASVPVRQWEAEVVKILTGADCPGSGAGPYDDAVDALPCEALVSRAAALQAVRALSAPGPGEPGAAMRAVLRLDACAEDFASLVAAAGEGLGGVPERDVWAAATEAVAEYALLYHLSGGGRAHQALLQAPAAVVGLGAPGPPGAGWAPRLAPQLAPNARHLAEPVSFVDGLAPGGPLAVPPPAAPPPEAPVAVAGNWLSPGRYSSWALRTLGTAPLVTRVPLWVCCAGGQVPGTLEHLGGLLHLPCSFLLPRRAPR